MKLLIGTLVSLLAFSAFAQSNYDETCARRYIDASVHLVDIAKQFNRGEIGTAEYAAKVSYVDSSTAALRAYCMNENSDSMICVDKTKPVYKKIRGKMNVINAVRRKVTRISVSELDLAPLAKGAVRGFFRSLTSGNNNICTL